MTPTELYLFLLADSFITGLVLPARHDLVFSAMRIFGGYNIYLVSLVSATGIWMAACLNWLLGRALISLRKETPILNNSAKRDKILHYLRKHGYLLGLLGFIPIFGPIIIVFTGMLRTNLTKLLLLVFIVNLLRCLVLTM